MFPELSREPFDDVKDHQLLKDLADGMFDGEPDLFYLNFN